MRYTVKFAVILAAVAGSMFVDGSSQQADAARRSRVACTMEYNPVCALGRNGNRATYANACVARASRARILHGGECVGGGPFSCFFLYSPVCARDVRGVRRTYPNLCEAELANAVVLSNGACR
jgi:hypothetical protein